MIYKANSTFSKTYHYAVAMVRKESGSTSMGFIVALFESIFAFVMIMLLMLLVRTMGVAIRGEFGYYILSGMSMFMIHNKVVSAIIGKKKTDPMLPILAISRGMMIVGTIIYELYMQFIIMIIFYVGCYIYYQKSPVHNWPGVAYCYLFMILWSVALGTLISSIMPINEPMISKLMIIYKRLSIITSGKMIPGNMIVMMGSLKALFLINPSFHLIDQLRSHVFTHYVPHVTNIVYPIQISCIFFCIAAILYFGIDKIR